MLSEDTVHVLCKLFLYKVHQEHKVTTFWKEPTHQSLSRGLCSRPSVTALHGWFPEESRTLIRTWERRYI